MEDCLKTLDILVEDGIISGYAIGGAIAAMYYIEPTDTFDLDVFVPLAVKGGLVSLNPIYTRLQDFGAVVQDEYVVIKGVNVQILPLGNLLIEEAYNNSIVVSYLGDQVNIFSLEYLMAICVQTGRAKDRARLQQFIEQTNFDKNRLMTILKQYELENRWKAWTSI